MRPTTRAPGEPDAASPEADLLDAVFGPGEGGTDPEVRARLSRRMFVRSHTGLAFLTGGATGLPVSAVDALSAFGWDTLSELADKPSTAIVTRGNDAATVTMRRRCELGIDVDELARRAGLPVDDVLTVMAGKRSVPMDVLVALAKAMGLCPIRFGAVPCSL